MIKVLLTILLLCAIYFGFQYHQSAYESEQFEPKAQLSESNNIDGIGNKSDEEGLLHLKPKSSSLNGYSIDEIIEAAEKRNPDAMYEVAYIHQKCQGVPDEISALEDMFSGINDEQAVDQWTALFVECEGFPRGRYSDKDLRAYVMYAARHGNIKAKLQFYHFAFSQFTRENIVRNSELITELKQETYQHLLDVKNAGDMRALAQLAMSYEDGNIVEQDFVEAHAYFSAYLALNPEVPDNYLDALREKMTDAEILRAQQMGEIYAECCG